MENNEREEIQAVAEAQFGELQRRLEQRTHIIRALNVALERDLDALFEEDQAA